VKNSNADPQQFTLVLKDLDEKTRGYVQTTKHGTESELRTALKEVMSEVELDALFKQAKPTA
jgi:hypothetical protein